jgi:catechol 2,3-dioxygenase-like lactoylglutathione lyase family enzyme
MFKDANAFSSFSVDNLEKAKEFYTNTLGLKVTEDKGIHWLHSADKYILIYPKENHIPATYTILNFSVNHLEMVMDKLSKLGVHFEHYDMPDLKTDNKGIFHTSGMKIAWFKDPAGNILSVLEQK